MTNPTQPLQELLDNVLARLSVLECQAGIPPGASPTAGGAGGDGAAATEDSPAVVAYDAYLEKAVGTLQKAADEIGTLENLGTLIMDAWTGARVVVLLASRSKMPVPPTDIPKELQPHLKPIQTALEGIRKLRLDRKYDWHIKSVSELAGCLSWVLIRPPPQTPAAFVKEAIASSTFWSNKIRKEYKGKDEKQIAFCDALKAVGADLVAYVTEHHKTGLTWNPQGQPIAETAKTIGDGAAPAKADEAKPAVAKVSKAPAAGGGGIGGLMAELSKKKTGDGSSAATGLRKVSFGRRLRWRLAFRFRFRSTHELSRSVMIFAMDFAFARFNRVS